MSEKDYTEFGGQADESEILEEAKPYNELADVLAASADEPEEAIRADSLEIEMDLIEARNSYQQIAESNQYINDKVEDIEIVLDDTVDDFPEGSEGAIEYPYLEPSDYETYDIPDGNTRHSSTAPYIRTLEVNGLGGVHNNELGLRNAVSVADGAGIPVSQLRMPMLEKDANGSGDTVWYAPDSDVGGRESGAQKSIQLRNDGTRDILQISDWDSAATALPAAADLFVFKDDSAADVAYAGKANLADWIQASLEITVSQITDYVAGVSDHGALTGLADDDHTQYLSLGGTGSRNAMTGTINSSASGYKVSISPNSRLLVGSQGKTMVDWSRSSEDYVEFLSGTKLYNSGVAIPADGGISCAGDMSIQSDNNGTDTLYIGYTAALDWNDIELWLAGDLKVNGTAGLSNTYNFNTNGADTGDIDTMTFTKGLLTGVTTVT